MKERIKTLMLSKKMKQQDFASALGISPATLSSIFNDRTRPTLSIVDAIKNTFPDISTDWLLFGSGEMFQSSDSSSLSDSSPSQYADTSQELNFSEGSQESSPIPTVAPSNKKETPTKLDVKYVDKPQRKVVEIKVYYDDYTYESFVPEKK